MRADSCFTNTLASRSVPNVDTVIKREKDRDECEVTEVNKPDTK